MALSGYFGHPQASNTQAVHTGEPVMNFLRCERGLLEAGNVSPGEEIFCMELTLYQTTSGTRQPRSNFFLR